MPQGSNDIELSFSTDARADKRSSTCIHLFNINA